MTVFFFFSCFLKLLVALVYTGVEFVFTLPKCLNTNFLVCKEEGHLHSFSPDFGPKVDLPPSPRGRGIAVVIPVTGWLGTRMPVEYFTAVALNMGP